ncbi:MAG TPA: hypothetical protein VIJ38_07855, partial [Acidobacteriaceae bacterium]
EARFQPPPLVLLERRTRRPPTFPHNLRNTTTGIARPGAAHPFRGKCSRTAQSSRLSRDP